MDDANDDAPVPQIRNPFRSTKSLPPNEDDDLSVAEGVEDDPLTTIPETDESDEAKEGDLNNEEQEGQKADILTKGLVRDKFEAIRKLLCGSW